MVPKLAYIALKKELLKLSATVPRVVDREAKWLRHWTWGLRVWGSIPVAPVMCRNLLQALNPHRLCSPSSNRYQVEQKLVLCECLEQQKMCCILPKEMRLKAWVLIPGGNWCNVCWTQGDIWTINTCYLFKIGISTKVGVGVTWEVVCDTYSHNSIPHRLISIGTPHPLFPHKRYTESVS